MNRPSIKQPSAILPLIMSGISIAMVLVHYAMFGIVYEEDEGTPAHLFQLLMVIQVPIIAYFAITWLPQAPKQALRILALQAAAMAAAFASVFFFTSG